MFQRLFTLLGMSALSFGINAQIVLQTQDIPKTGDTLVYSVAQLPLMVQPGQAGANKTWDFTRLKSSSQYVDRFKAVNQTNLIYSLFFGLPFSPQQCNLAKTENNSPTLPEQTGVKFSDAYNFYNNAGKGLVQKGFGASLNGIPIPVQYSSPEIVYAFPLNYNHRDTSNYTYKVDIPGIAYYGRKAKRINHVDGWGKVNTVLGTFEALRIRSELEASDTIYLDTLGRGLRIPLPKEIKYKWVAKNNGWPLVEITATDLGFFEVPNRVVFRDTQIVKPVDPTGIEQSNTVSGLIIYPNPATEIAIIRTELSQPTDMRYELLSVDGRILYHVERSKVIAGTAAEVLPIAALRLASGLYYIKISAGNSAMIVRPLIVDNP